LSTKEQGTKAILPFEGKNHKVVILFNYTLRHQDVWGNENIALHVLNFS
jgi:hypothetical protein